MIGDEDKPVFSKCVIFPIGVCLQIWAFIRMFAVLLLIGYFLYLLLVFTAFAPSDFFSELSILHLMVIVLVALIVDIGFLITLIVGVFKKSCPILKTLFYYEIYAVVAECLMIPLIFYLMYEVDPHFNEVLHYVALFAVGIAVVLVDVCVVLAVKSQLIILKMEEPEFKRIRVEEGLEE